MDYRRLNDAAVKIQTVQVRNTSRKIYPLGQLPYFPNVLTGRRY
jgi:hypothetical protein